MYEDGREEWGMEGWMKMWRNDEDEDWKDEN